MMTTDTQAELRSALLVVVRKLDFNAQYSTEEFNEAFDVLRASFTPDEIAYGELLPPAPAVGEVSPRPKIKIDREWIRQKALEEDGCEIGAGSLCHPLRVPETAMKLQAAIDKVKFLQPGLENSNSGAEDAMVDYLPALLETMTAALAALGEGGA